MSPVTLGAPASQLPPIRAWVAVRPQASLPQSAGGRQAQVIDVTLRRWFVPLSYVQTRVTELEQIAHAGGHLRQLLCRSRIKH
jgi:hypothetical protein